MSYLRTLSLTQSFHLCFLLKVLQYLLVFIIQFRLIFNIRYKYRYRLKFFFFFKYGYLVVLSTICWRQDYPLNWHCISKKNKSYLCESFSEFCSVPPISVSVICQYHTVLVTEDLKSGSEYLYFLNIVLAFVIPRIFIIL